MPASRVGYVREAHGGLPPGPRVLYVLGTRTSHGRAVRTAYRGGTYSTSAARCSPGVLRSGEYQGSTWGATAPCFSTRCLAPQELVSPFSLFFNMRLVFVKLQVWLW